MREQTAVLRVLRGFPITFGLASAFAIIFVSVPIMRLATLVRRQKSADIPLIMSASAYHEVAAKICEVLNRQGLSLQAAEPGWWVSAPMRLLTWLGGEALRSHVPRPLRALRGARPRPDALPERPGPAREPGASDLGARARRRGGGAHRGTADDRSQGSGARAAPPAAVEKLRPRSPRAARRAGSWRGSSNRSRGTSGRCRSTGTTGRSSTGRSCSWDEPRTANGSSWTPSRRRRRCRRPRRRPRRRP